MLIGCSEHCADSEHHGAIGHAQAKRVVRCGPWAQDGVEHQALGHHSVEELEIGTYTGYSALCLAEGLAPKGKLHTIDHNEELLSLQKKYFDQSPYKNQIQQYTGNALEVIPNINEKFDLVFIDADKSNYINYFNLVIDKMKKGGIILSDNVLWSGKVIEKLDPNDEDTKALISYNQLLKDDIRVETVLLPIRDGLTISRVI